MRSYSGPLAEPGAVCGAGGSRRRTDEGPILRVRGKADYGLGLRRMARTTQALALQAAIGLRTVPAARVTEQPKTEVHVAGRP